MGCAHLHTHPSAASITPFTVLPASWLRVGFTNRVEGKRNGEALFPWLLALPPGAVVAEVVTVAGEHKHLGFGPDILVPEAANLAAQTSSQE